MTSKIFINQGSFGQNSIYKWNKVSAALPDLEPVVLPPDELTPKMRSHIQTNNSLIIGGGDGTIHHTLNSVFQNDFDFHRVRLGIVGLGSSCSFLKSIPSAKKKNSVPYITDSTSESSVDVGKVFFKTEDGTQHTKYFVANGSIGFLALGNQLFNQKGGLTQWLKSFSTEAANNYIFVKSLFKYTPAHATVADTAEKKYLNIQFLKAKHYTGEYFFERGNSLQSGLLDFHLFDDLGPMHTLKVFYNLTLRNEFKSPTHIEFKDKSITIKTDQAVPLELDGEIYQGKEFLIECVPRKLRLMTELEKV
jgi:diacylglycerol kinase (ATP)